MSVKNLGGGVRIFTNPPARVLEAQEDLRQEVEKLKRSNKSNRLAQELMQELLNAQTRSQVLAARKSASACIKRLQSVQGKKGTGNLYAENRHQVQVILAFGWGKLDCETRKDAMLLLCRRGTEEDIRWMRWVFTWNMCSSTA